MAIVDDHAAISAETRRIDNHRRFALSAAYYAAGAIPVGTVIEF
jgi:hypothetical protein